MTNWKGITSNDTEYERWKREVSELDEEIKSFIQFDPDLGRKLTDSGRTGREGMLEGIPFAVKDNIAVKSFKLTCGSEILKEFTSTYNATAVEKLIAEGAFVAGKTNLDEFGMGSSTENSAFFNTRNPWNLAVVPGGSSGGSAASVAAGMVPFALGSDTGGSVRQPASFCGVYGLKPTYGSVSRYGLVAYASSLEVIGILAREIDTLERVFETIKGEDVMDQSSLSPDSGESGKEKSGKENRKKTIGIPEELENVDIDSEIRKSMEESLVNFRKSGFDIRKIRIPTLEYVVSAYYVIATAEASANLARFDGIRYGYRDFSAENPEELMLLSREKGFGEEVKLRILLGTYVLRSGFQEQYYIRAQKIRTAIRNDFSRAFKDVDLIMMPVYPRLPFEFENSEMDPFSQKLADIFTCTANLTGLPALSFPISLSSGLPIGMQLMAPPFEERRILEAARLYGNIFPVPIPSRHLGSPIGKGE